MSASPSEPIPVNRWPLNQDAKKRLLEAGVSPNAYYLYLLQLLELGFDRGLPIMGPGGGYRDDLEMAAHQLFGQDLKPADIMRWFLSNLNAGDQSEQNDTLRRELGEAKDWREAAQSLMEWFYDLKASRDPYYRPAPHIP